MGPHETKHIVIWTKGNLQNEEKNLLTTEFLVGVVIVNQKSSSQVPPQVSGPAHGREEKQQLYAIPFGWGK